ncbi:MAG: hypothetical protein CMA46_01750 [Euryarchaeota archaeon]|nr:hypothetical protein [Euryarchaeota archaeon]
MYSVGHKPDRTEGDSELIGGLSLVGMRGSFVGILNQRQLTIENRIGQGLRIDLESISKMRHMNVPILPNGTPIIGGITAVIGYSILVPPLGWIVSAAGVLVSLTYFRLRSSVLVIEDGDKSRHMIGGREGSLMRLCLMTDRLRRGSSIEEARSGLEKIENELPMFPAFQDAGGMPAMKALPWPPSPPEIELDIIQTNLGHNSIYMEEEKSEFEGNSDFVFGGLGTINEEARIGFGMSEISPEFPTTNPSENSISAYERAWGREETPSWYREKEPVTEVSSRDVSDYSETTDIFGFGGMFDSEHKEELETVSQFGFESSFDMRPTEEITQRPPSSSQMIRRAHNQHGFPKSDYRDQLLPTPTEEAVREECVPGIVRQARAKKADSVKYLTGPDSESNDLNDYPGVSSLVASMNGGRFNKDLVVSGRRKTSWIESLLRPKSRTRYRRDDSYVSQYGDIDGTFDSDQSRFQSSQHIRLRSDQDHQADIASRPAPPSEQSPVSARAALDSVVERVSSGKNRAPKQLTMPSGGLKFSQLRKAPTKGEKHHIPGVRRLE